ncbi:hypothetical protein CHL79_16045 [Delftia acidovorans]|uniref:phage tail protein n=1 Tax=Delftia acidovorans TaxID=80866 RepID=UPI000BC31C37|nr:phage tail protein [Delftia acidovorans]ATH13828.1 hypothetical protein CHL79_16045 [Delftia acidovorans]
MATAPTVRRHILPPQVTPLERAVDQATPQWGDLADAVEPASVRGNAAFQPWIAMQWQVARFAPYFPDLGALLTHALPWLRERGNGAGVRRALGWLGYDTLALRIEEDGYLLHLDPGRLVSDADLLHIARVVRASIPLHVSFYRVYHGDDVRALRYDGSRYDGALWDNDSGGWVELDGEEPVKVSQAERHTTVSPAPLLSDVLLMALGLRHTAVTSADALTYDAWAYDSEIMRDVSMGSAGITTTEVPQYLRLLPTVMAADGHLSVSAWPAPDPIAFGGGRAFAQAPIPLDNTRTWRGAWDSATWAIVCPTITTRLD